MQTLATKHRHYGHRKITVSLMQNHAGRVFIAAEIDAAATVLVAMPSRDKAQQKYDVLDLENNLSAHRLEQFLMQTEVAGRLALNG